MPMNASPRYLRRVQTLDGDIDGGRGIARVFEASQRRGNPQGLMAQLITSD